MLKKVGSIRISGAEIILEEMMKRVEANAAKSMTQLLGCCYAKGGIWSNIIFRFLCNDSHKC